MVVFAALLPSLATAFAPSKPLPLEEQVVVWSDMIVVGVVREADSLTRTLVDPPKTIDVEQWVVPAHSRSKSVQIKGGNTYQARFGRRSLLLLRWPRIGPLPGDSVYAFPMRSAYSALKVIDLEDAHDVAWGLDELNSPWIPHVTSATSYPWIDWESHPINGPEMDPRLIEIERILKDARATMGNR
jgi:hypothetical protein